MIQLGDMRMYTVADVAEMFGRTIRTVYGWMADGTLDRKNMRQVKGKWYIPEESLRKLFEQGTPDRRRAGRGKARKAVQKKPKRTARKRRAAKP